MTYGDAIAKRILHICNTLKITSNKFSNLLGVRPSTIDNILKGKTKNPKLNTLHRISVELEITISESLNFPEMNHSIFDDE